MVAVAVFLGVARTAYQRRRGFTGRASGGRGACASTGRAGYLARHVMSNVARGAAKSWRAPSDIALIVPVMTIVGDSDEGMLLRGTDDKGVDVLVVTGRFIHE